MSLKPRIVDFDETWQKLTPMINSVVTSSPVLPSTWNERFTDVYALCVAYPEPLTDQLYSAIKGFLEHHVMGLYESIKDSNDMLQEYYKHWVEFSRGAQYLDLLFRYLNQQHIKASKKQPFLDLDFEYSFDNSNAMMEIGELALDTWHNVLIEKVGETLVEKVLSLIEMDRSYISVNRSVIYGVIQSFVIVKQYWKKQSLKLYEDLFEKKYLEHSERFYKIKAAIFMFGQDVSSYMKKVLELFSEEELRSANFLNKSSYPKVTKTCRQVMVSDHAEFLLASAKDMIQQNRKTDLMHLYTLLKHVPDGLNPICSELQKYIQETGLQMLKTLKEDSNIATNLINCILDLHSKFTQLTAECFQNHKFFVEALQKGCRAIVNHREKNAHCRSPELLSRYCDGLLRKSAKGLSENDIDEKLKNSIIVFKYIEDKDLFQKFYSRSLAKRLIHGLCSSMYMEEAMINRLKGVCGYDFTSKLHRMFNDIRLSSDLNSKFSEHLKNSNENIHLSFNVNVLQAGAWPLGSTQTALQLPEELTKSVSLFHDFYNAKFHGRKLSWLHHLAQAEVKVQLSAKTYFVSMSTYQLAVLLLFNDCPVQTVSFIERSTDLSGKELERTLCLLCDAKLLIKQDCSGDDHTYNVNTSFSNKRTRFKIATAMQKDATQEVQSTHSAVVEDRKLYLQAAIVRIMKARKVLKHNDLIREIIETSRSRFSPSISVIKKSIESLIEKTYLERSPDSPDEYKYLA